jgi:hypothetical protein
MAEPGEYQITREGGEKVLRINYEGAIYTPSIEDDRNIMSRRFDIILDVGKVSKIVFLQREEYEYDWPQVRLLLEVVDAYKKLVKEENILDFGKMAFAPECQRFLPAWSDFLRDTIMHQLKEDPVGAFVSLVRRHREEMIKQQNPPTPEYASCGGQFVAEQKKLLYSLLDFHASTSHFGLVAFANRVLAPLPVNITSVRTILEHPRCH